jgi:GTP-binding protein EngB required for normal cell division
MKILSAEYLTTIVTPEKREFIKIPEVCFIGRSNVGSHLLIIDLLLEK